MDIAGRCFEKPVTLCCYFGEVTQKALITFYLEPVNALQNIV